MIYERGKNNADPPRSPSVWREDPFTQPQHRGDEPRGGFKMPPLGLHKVKAAPVLAFGLDMGSQSFLGT